MICGGISRLAKYWHQMAEAKTSMPASLKRLALLGREHRGQLGRRGHQDLGGPQEHGPPGRLVRLPVAGRLGGGVEGGVELLAGALGRLGEDLARGGVADAEGPLGRRGFPRDGHDELGHGAPRLSSPGGLPHPGPDIGPP